jgi:hypothetical protein
MKLGDYSWNVLLRGESAMTVFSKQGKSSRATMLVAILGILSILTGCGENDAQLRNTSPDRQLIRDFSSDNPFKMEDNSEKAAVEAVQLVIR